MKISCFLLGCLWDEKNACVLGQEALQYMRCSRCGSHRYMPLDQDDA